MNIRKAISSLFLIVVSVVYSGNILDTDTQQDQVLRRLYGMMESKETFMSEKEGRISAIKMMLATPNISNLQQYEINLQLYNEYKTYISDSAIHYAKQNVELAGRLGDRYRMNESKLSLTSLYIISGLYVESLDILNQIDIHHIVYHR